MRTGPVAFCLVLAACNYSKPKNDPVITSQPVATPAVKPADVKPISLDTSQFKAVGDVYLSTDGQFMICSNGVVEAPVKLTADGTYEIIVTAGGVDALNEMPKFKVKMDGADVGAETTVKSAASQTYSFKTKLKAGDRKLGIEFTNDVYEQGVHDRNLILDGVVVKYGG